MTTNVLITYDALDRPTERNYTDFNKFVLKALYYLSLQVRITIETRH